MQQNTNYEEFTISRQIVSFSGVRARAYEPTINETKCYEESNYFLFRKADVKAGREENGASEGEK